MPERLPDVGKRIRAAREARGLSRAELARRCGISRRHIAAIEAGANFSVAYLLALHSALGDALPLDELPSRNPQPLHAPLGQRVQEPAAELSETVLDLVEAHRKTAKGLRALGRLLKTR